MAEDRETFEERAAIMEYDGKQTRVMAEALARHASHVAISSPSPALPPSLPPEKMGKHYIEFQEFWRTRKHRR